MKARSETVADLEPVFRVASIIPRSEANGPGVRTVVHFGGCTLGCAGCFNPQLWPLESESYRTIRLGDLVRELVEHGADFTFSGGEPMQQPLWALLTDLRYQLRRSGPSFVIYTGYIWDELTGRRKVAAMMADALVMGRYNPAKTTDKGFCSSGNQELRLVSSRYTEEDFKRKVEVIISANGQRAITGIPTEKLRKDLV